MKAVVNTRPNLLEYRDIDKPAVPDDGVLVRVRASSVNTADLFTISSAAALMRRMKPEVVGRDFAGVVEATGKSVTGFQTGDEVFGATTGAMAEYLVIPATRAIARKPAGTSFAQAAAAPLAATTALQAIRDHGHVQPGQKVLVNGASGAVGTFAVQVARALGAEVTAVCSTRNLDTVRSLGSTSVIDYTAEDFTRRDERYDLLIDIAGTRRWSEYRRVLQPRASFVSVGAKKPLNLLMLRLASIGASQKYSFFIARLNQSDLATLRELMESGKLTSMMDKQYDLAHAAEAFAYLKAGHARGKVVVTV